MGNLTCDRLFDNKNRHKICVSKGAMRFSLNLQGALLSLAHNQQRDSFPWLRPLLILHAKPAKHPLSEPGRWGLKMEVQDAYMLTFAY